MNQEVNSKDLAITIFGIIVATIIITGAFTYQIMQRQPDQMTVTITVVPQELYPLNLDGWTFKLQFGEPTTFYAKNGGTQFQDTTLYGLLYQIKEGSR